MNLRGNAVERAEISRLTNLVAHRGPFGKGIWFSENRDLAFGHRRLEIIDPGEGGYQPMVSADGRPVIVYNGEIYNTRLPASEKTAASWRRLGLMMDIAYVSDSLKRLSTSFLQRSS
ncbi:hypothetical protein [Bradyrhizobium sp. SRL28]|uniref:hypothetical protein n=1 Tax=Bradyrhizobium sp. SRL28 TaxID=2836178 RepID=UPI00201C8291|nr:hypothetical protein [Bradyrhizobium sp. SRL28]